MRERPILFSGQMVRAILEGRKTQTRRVVRPQPYLNREWRLEWSTRDGKESTPCWIATRGDELVWDFGPGYGAPGDRLWVRETWGEHIQDIGDARQDRWFVYRADGNERPMDNGGEAAWRPSIHMPRWASRIDLEITEVRVQRLQEISEEDAIAGGVRGFNEHGCWVYEDYQGGQGTWRFSAKGSFASLWDSINGNTHPWARSNPWVWAVRFKVVKGGTHA